MNTRSRRDVVGALIMTDPEVAREIRNQTLGPIMELPRADRQKLIQTLDAWLAAGCLVTAAARALQVHRNTVLNHLRHVERLTGLYVGKPFDLVELTIAVRAHRMIEEVAAWDRAIREARAQPWCAQCAQCGQPWEARACGPTHAVVKAAPAKTDPPPPGCTACGCDIDADGACGCDTEGGAASEYTHPDDVGLDAIVKEEDLRYEISWLRGQRNQLVVALVRVARGEKPTDAEYMAFGAGGGKADGQAIAAAALAEIGLTPDDTTGGAR